MGGSEEEETRMGEEGRCSAVFLLVCLAFYASVDFFVSLYL